MLNILQFGKFKGNDLRWVGAKNPGYVRWLVSQPVFKTSIRSTTRLPGGL